MVSETLHCGECRTEFVGGITACSDCGGPLQSGELPPHGPESLADSVAAAMPAADTEGEAPEPPDTLVATLPGEDAELVAKAMTMERITSLLECEGSQELRGPHEPPKPALARRRPVSIYVAHSRVDEARAIIESMTGTDLIGEQWREGAGHDGAVRDDAGDDAALPGAVSDGVRTASSPPEAPRAEGAGRYVILLGLVTLLVGLFVVLL